MTQSSFHVNGFWYHVNWNAEGTMGFDQHGWTWFNKSRPISEGGLLSPKPEKKANQGQSSKELFMLQREAEREFFHTRSALMK